MGLLKAGLTNFNTLRLLCDYFPSCWPPWKIITFPVIEFDLLHTTTMRLSKLVLPITVFVVATAAVPVLPKSWPGWWRQKQNSDSRKPLSGSQDSSSSFQPLVENKQSSSSSSQSWGRPNMKGDSRKPFPGGQESSSSRQPLPGSQRPSLSPARPFGNQQSSSSSPQPLPESQGPSSFLLLSGLSHPSVIRTVGLPPIDYKFRTEGRGGLEPSNETYILITNECESKRSKDPKLHKFRKVAILINEEIGNVVMTFHDGGAAGAEVRNFKIAKREITQ